MEITDKEKTISQFLIVLAYLVTLFEGMVLMLIFQELKLYTENWLPLGIFITLIILFITYFACKWSFKMGARFRHNYEKKKHGK